LRRRVAVAAEPVGIHAAYGEGQAVGAAIKVDRSGFAFVCGHDSECGAIRGREGIAHVSDCGSEFRPANLHVELMRRRVLHAPPRRIDRNKGGA
jgi:hypothetical protein